jgi:hypothetical protein
MPRPLLRRPSTHPVGSSPNLATLSADLAPPSDHGPSPAALVARCPSTDPPRLWPREPLWIPYPCNATPLHPVVQHHLETFLAQATETDPLAYGVPSWVDVPGAGPVACTVGVVSVSREPLSPIDQPDADLLVKSAPVCWCLRRFILGVGVPAHIPVG